MKLVRTILFPFVPIYYLVTWLRNKLYDLEVFKSKSYKLPIICVGNLSAGGTGKTPMTEYLIRLLKDKNKIAVLSRGYGRNTNGFVIANFNTTAEIIGDEPFQFYSKFSKDVTIAVSENRQEGIEKLRDLKSPEVIILDDAYQHRKVKAGFNILLTTHDDLYIEDIVLPTGNLREPRAGAKRADVIVVTKCPNNLSSNDKRLIEKQLQLHKNQELYFSTIKYSNEIISKTETISLQGLKEKKFTLVTGIAKADLFLEYLKSQNLDFEHLNFKDHHNFSEKEIEELETKQFIVTTEKDYVRLESKLENSNLFYLPIESEIDDKEFNNSIIQFITNFKR